LSIRYDSEYTKFEDKIHSALFDKDRELEEMRHRVESQQAHNDELEREIENLNRDRVLQETMLKAAVEERDQSRRTVAEL
jgi:cell division protein FtsL